MLDFIAGIFLPASTLIDELHVSDEERGKLRNEFAKIQSEMHKSSTKLMIAEANSPHLITSIWRPICALILFSMILLDGFKVIVAPSQVYDLAQIFLGVYSGGRSLEKVAKIFKG
tara:strand:+ start:445 stop:789 length:345 start_codon:yes stop_codon:yes gene_type:complete